ncbi:hypothetical protein ACF064_02020 [Streptomyces sp. NPDC015492]
MHGIWTYVTAAPEERPAPAGDGVRAEQPHRMKLFDCYLAFFR